MPEYLSPGVYIEEVSAGPRPIEGVGTAMAAFVGFAPSGPVNQPVLVTNWTQYTENFGAIEDGGGRNPHLSGAYLSHAVYGYFLNGGGRCYVTRLGAQSAQSSERTQIPSKQSKAIPSFTVALKEGVRDDVQLEIALSEAAPQSGEEPAVRTFNLKVSSGQVVERYDNVSLGKGKGVKAVAEAVKSSKLISVLNVAPAAENTDPEPGAYLIKATRAAALPAVRANDFKGEAVTRSGVEGLEIAEDVTMVCCPDLMAAYEAGIVDRDAVKAVQAAMIAHCERMGDRIAILDPLPDLKPQDVIKWRNETNYDSKYAALYYPWIKVTGPDGKLMQMPPSGHIAGFYARNDNERGVHKAPANDVIRGVQEVSMQITKGEQDLLNPIGVNCIRSFTGRGIRVWGARTLSSDPAWRYVNVRRLFNFVEKSIERGTQWVVFEPNDPDLWARVKRDVGAFLTTVWRSGALFGRAAQEAFFVKCDEETNPPEKRDLGQLVIEIGLAPVKPAEFVIFRISQFAGGGEASAEAAPAEAKGKKS